MGSFTSSGVANPAPNILFNAPAALAANQGLQQNALAIAGTQQAQDNAATFRQNAPGLLARDPTATGLAFGADPQAAVNALGLQPSLDQNRRLQFASDQDALGSVAGALINSPPAQRAALWAQARDQLIAGGHTNVPGPDYPGDAAMLQAHNAALSASQQFGIQGQALTTTPVSPMQSVPGGAYAGSGTGGVSSSAAPTSAGGDPAMAQSESGGDASAMSPLGYAGKYQMGTGALSDIGLYRPAQGENPNGNAWAGTFNIPGYPQVKTLADFRANPDAQDAAYGAHVDAIDQAIAATPGASKYDPAGLLAVAHLGGVTGMQRFVQTGGRYNPADANGTSLADYYAKFSGHDPGGMLTALRQGGVAGIKNTVLGGGKYGPPDAAGNVPVQLASNAGGATGMQPTATDAPSPMLSPQGGQSTDTRFQNMLQGIYAPAPSPVSGAALPARQPGTVTVPQNMQPPLVGQNGGSVPNAAPVANTPMPDVPTSPGTTSPTNATQYALSGSANALGNAPQPAAPSGNPMNALAGVGAPAAAPSASAQAVRPLFQGNSYVPAPNLPGYVLGLDAQGNRAVMRMPGAPPPKPPETKFVGGTMVQTDGSTGDVLRVVPNMVPDPSRTAQVTGSGPNGQNGTTLFQDGKPIGFVPASTQPIEMEAYKSDLSRAGQVAQQATDAEQQVQRALEARNYAKGLPTGAGGEDRAALSTWLKTYAPSIYPSFVKSGWLPDAPQAEEAAKVMLSQAAQDEKTMGGSGGLGLTERYAKANPSLNMTPPAIQAMSNLKAVTAQSAKDYADGYLGFFNDQQAKFTKAGGSYVPASNFDEQWHSGKNAQVYMAAVNAMNGKPFANWSQGLSAPDQQRALGIVHRVDPTSNPLGASGRPLDLSGAQPVQANSSAAPAGMTATGPNGQKLILRNGAWAPL